MTKVLTVAKLSKPQSVLLKGIKILPGNAYGIVLQNSFPSHHDTLRKYHFLIIGILKQ